MVRSVCTISHCVADPRHNGLSALGEKRVYRRLLIEMGHPEIETAQGEALATPIEIGVCPVPLPASKPPNNAD